MELEGGALVLKVKQEGGGTDKHIYVTMELNL